MDSVKLIKVKRIEDHRGSFSEVYSRKKLSKMGIEVDFVQDNHSVSRQIGTVRGLHFQVPPRAQAKLVRCVRGAIFDVAVDIRRGSPTFGKWKACELSVDNGYQLFIPVGFAHGFMTLEQNSEVVYKCSDYYVPETEGSLLWNDQNIRIAWPATAKPILSEKDSISSMLADFESPFIYNENS